jgi:hypothetical protein
MDSKQPNGNSIRKRKNTKRHCTTSLNQNAENTTILFSHSFRPNQHPNKKQQPIDHHAPKTRPQLVEDNHISQPSQLKEKQSYQKQQKT